ncbi:hypothetical protein A8924_4022 [Saccharopolyspora erythraea NRRL 2338]|uniref:Uncharacterized protein n=2 Tax=Saccharopolyspora erythraea TaxID=1836 RepID=A4FFT0_SACEN|nr:hypothetical protein [Saccharopolyspora erythraea]EQD81309.1 hypothetical protein N599_36975 [Saccharopolyspora erythraea D]PFG96618.1 hypothetical protein A8924_4022 [Saccharopolyspora erythraea NRRL 2338]QRK93095.1 hypothetical protein JQX30_18525 [Saccharopolyspora erythraea]CAM02905.1 hypothetical protein SACE_3631 [Saccharopolyspora erythraea NRRL 2338]
MTSAHLFEIQLGVYATEDDVADLVSGCARLLDDRSLPYDLRVVGPDQDQDQERMSPAERYGDLAHQWKVTHPDADAGARDFHEIQVGLFASRTQVDSVREALTRVVCADPQHRSPCPIPWESAYSGAEQPDVAERYGHLRPS